VLKTGEVLVQLGVGPSPSPLLPSDYLVGEAEQCKDAVQCNLDVSIGDGHHIANANCIGSAG
jgi:hypothetical protein